MRSAEGGRQNGVLAAPRRRRRQDSERGRALKGFYSATKTVKGPPLGVMRGGGLAMSTPRLWRQQPAAAAAQLRRGGGKSPQRVLVAIVSTALETSAAAAEGRTITVAVGRTWLAVAAAPMQADLWVVTDDWSRGRRMSVYVLAAESGSAGAWARRGGTAPESMGWR